MFLRLLIESFVRQRRRKLLAGIAILLGTTAVTAMLALATTIGDRIHSELAVYGANIIVTPKADQLEVKVGGVDVKPATGGAYLHESDLNKLKTIFWANNITGISPELDSSLDIANATAGSVPVHVAGLLLQTAGTQTPGGGALRLHPTWTVQGQWPSDQTSGSLANGDKAGMRAEAAVGAHLAARMRIRPGDTLSVATPFPDADPPFIPLNAQLRVAGIVSTGSPYDDQLILPLHVAQQLTSLPNAVSRVEISARTKPEDAFARQDPDTLSPAKHEIWYCSPYANSIAYQIREAIPGSDAQQVRRVEQTEGTVLARISGLMWLVSLAALLAAGFAVSAAMATAVLERRREIGLMRSLGASKSAIAALFYSESALLAVAAGTLGYLAGSALAYALGAHIFPGDGNSPLFLPVLLPVILAMALTVAIAGSTPSIRAALSTDPATTLRGDA